MPERDVKTGGEIHNKRINIYIAIDRTSWGAINILMVSLIYDKRARPIYWEILDKKGSSNLEEQQRVLGKILTVLSGHKIVVLGDREFCSVSLGKWLQEKSLYFCLRQKQSKNVKTKEGIDQEMRELGLSPGTQLFFQDVNITKEQGFGECDRRSCRVRSLMQLLLLQRSIFGERTMPID